MEATKPRLGRGLDALLGTNGIADEAITDRLRISRNTVLTAFEELAAQGLIEGRIGSGTRVCGAGPPCVPKIPDMNTLLREAHYPAAASRFSDPEGTPIYLHR